MGEILLSIVTGTYNRLASLQAMIESVRTQIPRHIGYEIVVVDGGSADGTIEWCDQQRDICLIRHGSLKGAIKAFTEGAMVAQGEYVVMGNDDITFHSFGLMRALAYLEEHRDCGAVAFADNRSHQAGITEEIYRVERMPAVGVDGKQVAVPYAQVGMIRRWLGNQVGWWGATDPIVGKARTYGGDNYLSARIWELGFSVDAVMGCAIDDGIVRDGLRQNNADSGRQDSAQYYARFPRGPQLRPFAEVRNPQPERLRVLVADIHEPGLPARKAREKGLADALAKVALTWQVDYLNEDIDLVAAAAAWQPHLILTQMHAADHINAAVLSRIRAAAPSTVIVNWNGDAHEEGLISADVMEALRYVDLQTVVNAKVLEDYQRAGIPAAYWQIGYKDPAEPYQGEVSSHDVLWLGNCYNTERRALITTLRAIKGIDVGIYGNCSGSQGTTHYDFAKSRALYERCQIAVGDIFPGSVGFVSNRMVQALSAGAFLLQQYSPRLDELNGWQDGVHYIAWDDLPDLRRKVIEWLKPGRQAKRQQIAAAGMAYVREHFSYDAQVRKLWELIP